MRPTEIRAVHPSGFTITLMLEEGDNLREQCSLLVRRGYLPAEEISQHPPICPRHGVMMVKRGKKEDTWYSHQVLDVQGIVHYCRGYPAKQGRGWEVLPA